MSMVIATTVKPKRKTNSRRRQNGDGLFDTIKRIANRVLPVLRKTKIVSSGLDAIAQSRPQGSTSQKVLTGVSGIAKKFGLARRPRNGRAMPQPRLTKNEQMVLRMALKQ